VAASGESGSRAESTTVQRVVTNTARPEPAGVEDEVVVFTPYALLPSTLAGTRNNSPNVLVGRKPARRLEGAESPVAAVKLERTWFGVDSANTYGS
jgi:hypothetical protein